MSIVTNIILVCSSSENADKVIADFSGYKYKNNSFSIVSIHDENLSEKKMER